MCQSPRGRGGVGTSQTRCCRPRLTRSAKRKSSLGRAEVVTRVMFVEDRSGVPKPEGGGGAAMLWAITFGWRNSTWAWSKLLDGDAGQEARRGTEEGRRWGFDEGQRAGAEDGRQEGGLRRVKGRLRGERAG